ncbi:hypothetical protein FOG50_00271 [Hanseniaspora uvarum]|uniref:Autophagy-related protein n=1 Tax=Hanseniaspora uvarum TaxID=29833 RepID=A0A1E5RIL2_HANUV|nr:hypothetical protein FOG50_00271 [Hanseniaspora uvarum]OEJ86741.1 Autophagy-related protein 8 [Hanseniaspora uvarum]
MTDNDDNVATLSQKSRIPFKAEYPFNVRKNECDRICQKYIDRIPVIVEKQGLDSTSTSNEPSNNVSKSNEVPALDKRKYLVPQSLTIGQFVYIIRKRIDLPPERAIFVFVNNGILPNTSSLMSQLYLEYKDADGFLYINYAGENTFGQAVFEVSYKN